jgi:hypothetical protein
LPPPPHFADLGVVVAAPSSPILELWLERIGRYPA